MRTKILQKPAVTAGDDMAQRALRFFLDASHPETGLTLDRTKNVLGSAGQTRIASTAATGYAVTAFCIGVHYGWLERRTATERIERVLTTIETTLDGKAGFYYHFIDWETGKREWNSELSSIDTALLQLGLLLGRGLTPCGADGGSRHALKVDVGLEFGVQDRANFLQITRFERRVLAHHVQQFVGEFLHELIRCLLGKCPARQAQCHARDG